MIGWNHLVEIERIEKLEQFVAERLSAAVASKFQLTATSDACWSRVRNIQRRADRDLVEVRDQQIDPH
jgi:hypothetical protein